MDEEKDSICRRSEQRRTSVLLRERSSVVCLTFRLFSKPNSWATRAATSSPKCPKLTWRLSWTVSLAFINLHHPFIGMHGDKFTLLIYRSRRWRTTNAQPQPSDEQQPRHTHLRVECVAEVETIEMISSDPHELLLSLSLPFALIASWAIILITRALREIKPLPRHAASYVREVRHELITLIADDSLRRIDFLSVNRRDDHSRVTIRSSECRRKNLRSAMDEEVRRFQRRVAPEILLSNLITISIFGLSFYGYLPWRVTGEKGSEHVSLRARLAFTLQWSFVDLLPLLVGIFAVFNRRRQTWAINPVDPRGDEFIRSLKGILENTLEQFLVKFVLSLILCTVLRSRELILLPTFTFLYLLGRLTFALGYPLHRSFGMTMNFVSVLLVSLLIATRLVSKGLLFSNITWNVYFFPFAKHCLMITLIVWK